MQKHAFLEKIKKTFSLFTGTYGSFAKKVFSKSAETRMFSLRMEGQFFLFRPESGV